MNKDTDKPYSFTLSLSDEALAMSETEFSDVLKSNLGCMGIGYWEWEGRNTVWDNNGVALVAIDYTIPKQDDDWTNPKETISYWTWSLGKLCGEIYEQSMKLYKKCLSEKQ